MRRLRLCSLPLALLASCAGPAQRDYAVFFVTDSAQLSPAGQQVVAGILASAQATRARHILIEGHANGDAPHDFELADQRAMTVARWLLDGGIPASAIDVRLSAERPSETGFAARNVLVRLQP